MAILYKCNKCFDTGIVCVPNGPDDIDLEECSNPDCNTVYILGRSEQLFLERCPDPLDSLVYTGYVENGNKALTEAEGGVS